MLGVHFDTTITVFGHALNSLHLDRGVTSWAKQAMVQRWCSPFLTTFLNDEPASVLRIVIFQQCELLQQRASSVGGRSGAPSG